MHKVLKGIDNLKEVLAGFNCKKLFLVVDSSFPFLNIKEQIEPIAIEKVFFSDFTPNPLYEQVVKGVKLLREEKCDAILAVGGGSAIDVAKCIKLAVVSKEGTEALIPPLVSTMVEIPELATLPLIAIPTTAGTGSESTHNAVMYYKDAKQTVTSDAILPDVAILEPSVLKTLPLYQKKCTMMDALCQGIESWWSVNSTDESKEYSKKAVELIMANWEAYVFENETNAMEQIMIAANYAGRAINIAQTTAAHAMSYKITSLYKLPHGHAVAMCLPEIWKYMIENMDKCCDIRGIEYLNKIFIQIAVEMGCASANDAIILFRRMMAKQNLLKPSIESSVRDLEILYPSVNPVRLKNNPIKLSLDGIINVYSKIINKQK